MTTRPLGLVIAAAVLVAACSSDDGTGSETTSSETTSSETTSSGDVTGVTLVVYDSFPDSGTPLNAALDAFSDETGIDVEILVAGDTGTMLAKASLTAGNPEGDVMWGIDNTFLSRAVEDGIFEPYESPGLVRIPPQLTELVPDGVATPVDFGDVCVNYDVTWFDERGLDVPATFDDLLDPAYAGLLVVQNPATSSPGLAFLLATIDEFGADGWQAYWQSLVDNDLHVVDSWTEAYYEQFSATGGGSRPLVVSYGSSPPAGVIYDEPPTGALESTCFRQVEFAGVLRGTDAPDEARRLVDFLIGEQFQSELALNLFVYPANRAVELPPEFLEAALMPSDPRTIDPAEIEANRADWIDEWTELVIG